MTKEIIAVLLAFALGATQASGFEPGAAPVSFVSDAALAEIADCSAPCADMVITADQVYFDEALADGDDTSLGIVVHQLAHAVQFHSGDTDGSCEAHERREREAYRAQAEYLASRGRPAWSIVDTVGHHCNE